MQNKLNGRRKLVKIVILAVSLLLSISFLFLGVMLMSVSDVIDIEEIKTIETLGPSTTKTIENTIPLYGQYREYILNSVEYAKFSYAISMAFFVIGLCFLIFWRKK